MSSVLMIYYNHTSLKFVERYRHLKERPPWITYYYIQHLTILNVSQCHLHVKFDHLRLIFLDSETHISLCPKSINFVFQKYSQGAPNEDH